jgi:hypothetical protein
MFEVVDIVEQSPKLIAVAKDQLSPTGKVDQYYCTGLQDWYDICKYTRYVYRRDEENPFLS